MREVAAETLREVKKAMGLTGAFNRISRKAEDRRKKEAANAAKSQAGALPAGAATAGEATH